MKPKYSDMELELQPIVSNEISKIASSRTLPGGLIKRAQVIQLAVQGLRNVEIAKELHFDRTNVGVWRRRFTQALPEINGLAEAGKVKECRNLIVETLSDKKRKGRPRKFSEEERNQVTAMACTHPTDWELPHSQWSCRLLAEQLIQKEILSDISRNTVSRILRENNLRPHKIDMWLFSPDKLKNPFRYIQDCKQCSHLLRNVQNYYGQGIQIISIDEKPGIQVLTPDHEGYQPRPGQAGRYEMFYTRKGKLDLIQGMNLATGELFRPYLSDRHTEIEFAQALEHCIDEQLAITPEDKIIILCDNLATHKSESVVRMIAKKIGFNGKRLGKKLSSGILKDLPSREKFLIDSSHQIYFIYTPRHASWLNPIECFFSVFHRSVLSKAGLKSPADLRDRILRYQDWYNENSAKPFEYKFSGFEWKLDQHSTDLLQGRLLPEEKKPKNPLTE